MIEKGCDRTNATRLWHTACSRQLISIFKVPGTRPAWGGRAGQEMVCPVGASKSQDGSHARAKQAGCVTFEPSSRLIAFINNETYLTVEVHFSAAQQLSAQTPLAA
jgi:hypothetical protein